MKIRNLIYIISLFILSSCNYEFELGDINAGEKLVLYCMPGAGKDTTPHTAVPQCACLPEKENSKRAFPMPMSTLWLTARNSRCIGTRVRRHLFRYSATMCLVDTMKRMRWI